MENNISVEDHITEHLKQSLNQAVAADRYAAWDMECPEFKNLDFMHAGVIRATNRIDSGRHFIQFSDEVLDSSVVHSTYFKALKSTRRRDMLKAVERQSYHIHSEQLNSFGVDYLSEYEELDGYTVEAADGHFIDHAYHTDKNDAGRIFAAGFIYVLNLRNGLIRPFCRVTNGTRKSHEGPVFRKYMELANKRESNKALKRISIYDKAMNNYKWWDDQKRHRHYMVSLLKGNAVIGEGCDIEFDATIKQNTGVISYKSHRSGTSTFNVVEYKDPETNKIHIFITTLPRTINPGTVAMLYYKRWTIEKAFNNYKSDMKEHKAWSSELPALDMQMRFTSIAYNMMRVSEEKALAAEPDQVHPSENKYKMGLEKRNKIAQKKGLFVNPMHFGKRLSRIKSFTIRAFQNAIIRRTSYNGLINKLIKQLEPPLALAGGR